MPNRSPEDRTILIRVDPYTRDFNYTFEDGADASSVRLINGDRLIWVLDPAITPRTFQIDFGPVNPFDLGTPVSLRGIDGVSSPYVSFPKGYIGRRQLKYNVLLGNGWQDDPDVVPSPTDPGSTFQAQVLVADPSDCMIFWTDAGKTDIRLDIGQPLGDPVNMAAKVDATGLAKVTWQWDSSQDSPQRFTLAFGANPAPPPPPNWANSSDNSTSTDPALEEDLGTGAAPFTITTYNINGVKISKTGTLTIT